MHAAGPCLGEPEILSRRRRARSFGEGRRRIDSAGGFHVGADGTLVCETGLLSVSGMRYHAYGARKTEGTRAETARAFPGLGDCAVGERGANEE